jgi:hypothetical protein
MKRLLFTLLPILNIAQSNAMESRKYDAETIAMFGYDFLVKAAKDGDLEEARRLLNAGASPNHESFRCAAEHPSICKLLIERKANINEKDDHGRTALMWQAGYGHTNICQLLLDSNASINAHDKEGWTALKLTAEHNKYDTGKLLIENKADVNDTSGNIVALIQAAWLRDKTFCELFINNGADVFAKGRWGKTCLRAATAYPGSPNAREKYLYIFDAMCRKLYNKKALIALLGIKKFKKSPLVTLIDQYVIREIAQTAMKIGKQHPQLESAINAIEDQSIKTELSQRMNAFM